MTALKQSNQNENWSELNKPLYQLSIAFGRSNHHVTSKHDSLETEQSERKLIRG
jgi:hypothetical protein